MYMKKIMKLCFKILVKRLPAKRLGEPIEIAKCVLYLFENDYVTGTIQYVDGGYRIAI
jgi:3-oxoacyl-[acyl-carrier protein] reductase